MNRIQNLFRTGAWLALLGALTALLVLLFRAAGGLAPLAGPLVGTAGLIGTPPPSGTPEPGPMLSPQSTPLIVYANQSPTPWATFTPYPVSTRKPGPTETAIPLQPPAQDSAGEIRYVVYSHVGLYDNRGAIQSVKVNTGGNAPESTKLAVHEMDADWFRLQLSPGGNRVAVIENVEAGDIVTILDTETGKEEPLFKSDAGGIGSFLGWHPDNRHVLYLVETLFRGPFPGLWLVDTGTGEAALIASQQIGDIYDAAVSPDGRNVVYHHSALADELWVINIDGSQPRMIYAATGTLGGGYWSPDGKQIAFTGDGLMVINPDGTNLRQLIKPWTKSSSEPRPPGPAGGGCFGLTWSPDSQQIACVSYDNHNLVRNKGTVVTDKDAFEGAAVYIINVTTGEVRPLLADGSTGHIDPAWSPDGSQIAFASIHRGSPEIWVVNVDGTDLRQLTNGSLLVRFPLWIRSRNP